MRPASSPTRLRHAGDDARLNAAFEAYAAAARRAQTTLIVSNGIVAGHAWRNFLHVGRAA